jgi:mono/diheme cytochrome c family protein
VSHRRTYGIIFVFILAGLAFAGAGDGSWLHKVPTRDRERINPLAHDPDAPRAGAKIYREHCAPCHGDNAEGRMQGRHYRPNLHSNRMKEATPGDLFWLLTNGSLHNGMPSWSRLPEPMRWQVVTYLKFLP